MSLLGGSAPMKASEIFISLGFHSMAQEDTMGAKTEDSSRRKQKETTLLALSALRGLHLHQMATTAFWQRRSTWSNQKVSQRATMKCVHFEGVFKIRYFLKMSFIISCKDRIKKLTQDFNQRFETWAVVVDSLHGNQAETVNQTPYIAE